MNYQEFAKQGSNEALADEYGRLKAEEKAAQQKLNVLKEQFKKRRRKIFLGKVYKVTVSEVEKSYLDRNKLSKELGERLASFFSVRTEPRIEVREVPKSEE